jgi:hypothetical protein
MPHRQLTLVAEHAAALRAARVAQAGVSMDAAAQLHAMCHALTTAVTQSLEGYRQWPAEVEQALGLWVAGAGPDPVVTLRQGLVLLELVQSLGARLRHASFPPAFLEEFRRSAQRIVERVADGHAWPGGMHDDVFRKDLALLCLRMLPCVSHVVCRYSGVPRRTLLKPQNLLAGLSTRTLFTLHGKLSPLIENHVHPEMTDRFDAAGREACYRLVCDLLRHWPDTLGLMGSSWYYDAAVGQISPHLRYLRDVPAGHGALFLQGSASDDAVGGALARSTQRRQLAERGLYQPRNVMMIWPRDALLASPFAGPAHAARQ